MYSSKQLTPVLTLSRTLRHSAPFGASSLYLSPQSIVVHFHADRLAGEPTAAALGARFSIFLECFCAEHLAVVWSKFRGQPSAMRRKLNCLIRVKSSCHPSGDLTSPFEVVPLPGLVLAVSTQALPSAAKPIQLPSCPYSRWSSLPMLPSDNSRACILHTQPRPWLGSRAPHNY